LTPEILDEFNSMSGMKSPLDTLNEETLRTEQELYEDNTKLVKGMLEFFKEGFECYIMLCRQSKSTKILDEINCYMIIQLIERGRFGITTILQRMRHIKAKIIDEVDSSDIRKSRKCRTGISASVLKTRCQAPPKPRKATTEWLR
jgi:hypothetical protein